MVAAEPFNILLVNDNPADLVAFQAALEELGQNLVVANSGREALRAALNEDFAVVLMDVNMPGLDGLETATLLRQREKTSDVPIIFVTATEYSGASEIRGYSLGAVDYIFTPVMPEILRAKVRALLDLRRRERRLLNFERRVHAKTLADLHDRLAEEARRSRSFSLSVDLMSVSGFDGYLRHANPSWETTLGFSREELRSRPMTEWVHPEDLPATAEAGKRLLAGETVIGFENRLRVKDGSYRWFLWNAAPLPEEELIYAVGRDITDRKLAEKALAEREAALEAANRELEAFSYSVSHDLRAPLRAIEGFSALLAEQCGTQLEATGQRYLERIRSATRHMGRLIDDLLNLSRVTRTELHRRKVDLSRLASEVVAELRAREPQRQRTVLIQEHMTAQGDPHLLRIVLENLLNNAFKFTARQGEPRVEVGMQHGPVFFVRDNGVGFDPAHADKLFGVFQRLHRAEEFPGTGIGLATIQRIIQRHGGRVWAEGAVGQGATFYFTLGPGA